MTPNLKAQLLVCLGVLLVVSGCKQAAKEAPKGKPPRPVEVAVLAMQQQQDRQIISASAASWKSEDLAFEVSGRIEWVAEPNTNVEGRIVNAAGDVVIAGDPIARIESETYRLQVEKAKAELSKAEQSVVAASTEIKESFPAQLRAAQADLNLAKIDRDRRVQLVQRNAGAQSDVDKAEANYQNAFSKIEQIKSTLKAKESELTSLNLQIEIANQALTEAKRDLSNCVLYSSFRGQISEVSVVPGSFAGAGNSVASVQMMNPIKVEFEVSAEDSRRLRDRQNVSVLRKLENGESESVDGYLYLIDPVADPQTRTFTVTVLVKNQNVALDENESDSDTPGIDQVWPMKYDFLPGADQDMNFLAEEAILEDAQGHFVWKIDSLSIGQQLPENRVLEVSKLRIQKGELQLPFLGNWLFRQVTFNDDSIDLEKTLIAGKLTLPQDKANQWNGSRVRIDAKRNWRIRPGDVVQVDLSSKRDSSGLFVPMDAVAHQGDKTFIVVLESEQNGIAKVKKTEVQLLPRDKNFSTSSMREVQPVGSESLIGQTYVTKGAHFLVEAQQVRVVGTTRKTDSGIDSAAESAQ